MRCGNCTKCDCQLGIGFAHCKCAGVVIKKRYGLIIFSIQVWFYQIHLSLLCISSSCSHFTILKFATSTKKRCLLLCNSAASVCKREKEGEGTNSKHQTQWHPNSNSHAQGLHCSCCYWRVNFTVTLCCCCLQQKQFPERARHTQKYLMSSSSSSSLASSLVATGIVFGHLDARDSLDSPRFFNR